MEALSTTQPPTMTDDSINDNSNAAENVATAFLLVGIAGLSTGLGGAVVCVPSLVQYATARVLAGGLAFSAGVMTMVSFIEIFPKSKASFEDAGFEENIAFNLALVCFFGGVCSVLLLHKLVNFVMKEEDDDDDDDEDAESYTGNANTGGGANKKKPTTKSDASSKKHRHVCHGICVSDLGNVLKSLEDQGLDSLETGWGDDDLDAHLYAHGNKSTTNLNSPQNHYDQQHKVNRAVLAESRNVLYKIRDEDGNTIERSVGVTVSSSSEEEEGRPPAVLTDKDKDKAAMEDEKKYQLMKTGLKSALAIALHNFPEGLATFVAALNDPKIGLVLAIATAVHNIPEGLCVALPIFYARQSKWEAVLAALLSGMTEFLAALLGWLVLANSFSDTLYAILFGAVAGMMVLISTKELMPTAHQYDEGDSLVTKSYVAGMVVIAASLVLFNL